MSNKQNTSKTPKENNAANAAVESSPKKRMKLEALSNLSGKYNLPFSEGQVFTIDGKRGKELVDNAAAKPVK